MYSLSNQNSEIIIKSNSEIYRITFLSQEDMFLWENHEYPRKWMFLLYITSPVYCFHHNICDSIIKFQWQAGISIKQLSQLARHQIFYQPLLSSYNRPSSYILWSMEEIREPEERLR